jgi:hypothetical protein
MPKKIGIFFIERGKKREFVRESNMNTKLESNEK